MVRSDASNLRDASGASVEELHCRPPLGGCRLAGVKFSIRYLYQFYCTSKFDEEGKRREKEKLNDENSLPRKKYKEKIEKEETSRATSCDRLP